MTYSRLQEARIVAYLARQGGSAPVRKVQAAVHMKLAAILPVIEASERLALGPEPPARFRHSQPSQGRRVVALRNEKLEEAQ